MSTSEKYPSGALVRDTVREGYAAIATGRSACCCGGGSCGTNDPTRLAEAIGYTAQSLASLPDGANMGLSCGNPVAIAALKEGQTVLDLGSGGGFDVFQAGQIVKAAGRVIGVDMTPEMLAKARKNIDFYQQNTGLDNVEFRLGEIEHLPVADNCIDVVLSNCVINLSPDKPQVWREVFRVLKPGGKVSVSDLALLQPLPEKSGKWRLPWWAAWPVRPWSKTPEQCLKQRALRQSFLRPNLIMCAACRIGMTRCTGRLPKRCPRASNWPIISSVSPSKPQNRGQV